MKNPARWHRQFFPGTLDHFENKDSLVNGNVESTCYSTNIILQDVTPLGDLGPPQRHSLYGP